MNTNKTKISKVTILWSEGMNRTNVIYEGPNAVDRADLQLLRISKNNQCELGYNKTKIEVTFEDGETYAGRWDVKKYGSENNDIKIRQHIRDNCEFYAGLRKPQHLSLEQYQACLRHFDPKEFIDFLNRYDI